MEAESMRMKLSALCRQQNRALAISTISRWVIICVAFTALVLLTPYFLSFENQISSLLQKTIFSVWVLGVFLTSFWGFHFYLSNKKSEKEFIHSIEKEIPDLEQRLITSAEFANREANRKKEQEKEQGQENAFKNNNVAGVSKEFLKQLHEDAKSKVESQPFQIHFANKSYQNSLLGACAAVICFAVLLDLSQSFRESTRLLVWPKALPEEKMSENKKPANSAEELAPTEISVQPGDVEMQRGEDLVISASVDNTYPRSLTLFTQDDQLNWRQIKMLPSDTKGVTEGSNKGSGKVSYTTTISQVTKDTVYYVAYIVEDNDSSDLSSSVRSPQFSISLFDLPRVENLSISYDYPDYTGIENQTEESGGDIVAPVGTKIKLSASLNKEVLQAALLLNGEKILLDTNKLTATGSFIVEKDGEYLIELVDNKSLKNKSPLQYYIRAIKDREPEITIRSPGKDKRVMPLEEIDFEIDANDDYGLTQFEFSYSIIGKDEKTINFLSGGNKNLNLNLKRETIVAGEKTLYLEDLAVKPGDIISYSVSVTDNNGLDGPVQKISDIYFLEVIPTTREFSRANGGGGRGGGGGGGGEPLLPSSNTSSTIKYSKKLLANIRNRTWILALSALAPKFTLALVSVVALVEYTSLNDPPLIATSTTAASPASKPTVLISKLRTILLKSTVDMAEDVRVPVLPRKRIPFASLYTRPEPVNCPVPLAKDSSKITLVCAEQTLAKNNVLNITNV